MNNDSSLTTHPSRSCGQSAGCTHVVSITPATGWAAQSEVTEGSALFVPLVGWGLQCDGEVQPLVLDPRSGEVRSFVLADEFLSLTYNGAVIYTLPISD